MGQVLCPWGDKTHHKKFQKPEPWENCGNKPLKAEGRAGRNKQHWHGVSCSGILLRSDLQQSQDLSRMNLLMWKVIHWNQNWERKDAECHLLPKGGKKKSSPESRQALGWLSRQKYGNFCCTVKTLLFKMVTESLWQFLGVFESWSRNPGMSGVPVTPYCRYRRSLTSSVLPEDTKSKVLLCSSRAEQDNKDRSTGKDNMGATSAMPQGHNCREGNHSPKIFPV